MAAQAGVHGARAAFYQQALDRREIDETLTEAIAVRVGFGVAMSLPHAVSRKP